MVQENRGRNSAQQREGVAEDTLRDRLRRLQEELHGVRLEQVRDRMELERAIERANTLAIEAEVSNIELNQIINTSVDGMVLIYEDFTVKRINETLLAFLAMGEDEARAKKCCDILQGDWCNTVECPLHRLSRGEERIEVDIERTGPDGHTVPFMFTATPFRGLDGELIGMVARFKDITARKYAEDTLKEANRQLERLASIDGLTQVANRRFFDGLIEKEWRRLQRTGEPLALVMCDIDDFKAYNDTYGHQQGDDCLREVSRIVADQMKRGGDCAARYGGEEFVALLPETSLKGAVQVAERIRCAVENGAIEHLASSVALHVTISLGVAVMIPSAENSPERLIEQADRALYRAKDEGRNRVAVDGRPG